MEMRGRKGGRERKGEEDVWGKGEGDVWGERSRRRRKKMEKEVWGS